MIWLWIGISVFWGAEYIFINMYLVDPNVIPREEQRVIYLAYMVALSACANVVAIWMSGAASDACRSRFGRRKPYIVLGGVVGGTLLMMFPIIRLFETIEEKILVAVILDALLSFFGDFATGSRYALLTDLTVEQERAKINGILNVPTVLGMALPIVLVEIIRLSIGLDWGFYISGGLMILATTTSVLFIKEAPIVGEQKTFRQYIKQSLNVANYRSHKPFYRALLGVALLSLGGNVFYPFIFQYITSYLHFTGNLFTLTAGTILLINLLVQIPMGMLSDRIGRKSLYKIFLPVDVVFLALFFFVGPGDFVLAILIGGIGITLYFTLKINVQSWMMDLVPETQRGSLLVYSNIADILPMAIGALIGGLINDYFTAGTDQLFHPIMFVFAAIIVACSFPVFYFTPETIKKGTSDQNR